MRKSVLLLLVLLISMCSYSQDNITWTDDSITISPSCVIGVGQKLLIGAGTRDDGSYKYLRQNRQGFNYAMTATSSNQYNRNETTVDPSYAGKYAIVKKIRVQGNKKRGYTYQLLVGLGTALNYECDIVQALKVNEIECDGCNKSMVKASSTSMADELKKLKELKDQGILTEGEFNQQKTKLLNSN